MPGFTEMVAGVEPFTCGAPATPSFISMRMIIAPGGVEATSICPFVALSGVVTVTEEDGCEELAFLALSLLAFVFGLAQARAASRIETRQQKTGSLDEVET